MTLYMPPHFSGKSREDALALMRSAPFATLVTTVAAREPHITHLPLLLLDESQLIGHMARANPHWEAFAGGHTVAIFHGPHAYVSPAWYVDPAVNVPTWNYAVVHAQGQPVLIDDAAHKLAIVDATSAAFEPLNKPWQRQVEGAKLEALIGNIVAFTLPLTRLEAKFKMNQNKGADDRAQVIAQLRATAHPDAIATADWMALHAPR